MVAGLFVFQPTRGDDTPPTPMLSDQLSPPVRLMADGVAIDTGGSWGHSSPCVLDLNRDGRFDLLVGDFSGKLSVYDNVGSSEAPKWVQRMKTVKENPQGSVFKQLKSVVFGDVEKRVPQYVQAGGVDAEVRIYCCIGGQSRLADINADGNVDLIMNSYDPGHCYFFLGTDGEQFAARQELTDREGVPVRSSPMQTESVQSFGSFFTPVDWDADGDFDLLIGTFGGQLKLRMNEGTAQRHEFATENLDVNTNDGQPVKVEGHLCPTVADWDGDELWDLIVGSEYGGVYWFRNVGDKTKPVFTTAELLVPKASHNGYDLLYTKDSDIAPGIRSQVEVVDYNADGKLDLLVGDFYTAIDPRPDLTTKEIAELESLNKQLFDNTTAWNAPIEALRKDFNDRYSAEDISSDAVNEEFQTKYTAIQQSDEVVGFEKKSQNLVKQMRPYLASVHGEGPEAYNMSLPHGFVWLYLKK